MKYQKATLIFFIVFIAFSLSTVAQNFKITGEITGIEDGTWLYLKTSSPQEMLDSTKVEDGKFNLMGKDNSKVRELFIHTRNLTDYLFFWAEQNTHLELKKGEFKKAIITGSKTQIENEILAKMKEPVEKRIDSLSEVLQAEKDPIIKTELVTRLKANRLEKQQIEIDYVKNNPNSLISTDILSVYASTWGKGKTTPLYENLSSEMKNTTYGKSIRDFITLNQEIKIGRKFADFEQTNTNGEIIKLSNIKAKYILLEFWGSWCGPCREENPNLVKTYNTYKSKGFEILGVAADDNKQHWLKAIKDDKLPWENVSDLKGYKNKAGLIYGVSGYPTNYLIDQNGIIIAKDLRGKALNKKLAELLK